jgi:hypothetical protein
MGYEEVGTIGEDLPPYDPIPHCQWLLEQLPLSLASSAMIPPLTLPT